MNIARPKRALKTDQQVESRFESLCVLLREYLNDEQIETIHQAYLFSAEAHRGQKRRTGEPYIVHPIAVATILAEMRMDQQSITAAILHDVIEDTPVNKENVIANFDEEVAEGSSRRFQ